jgi:hypothetical protein
VAVIEAVTRINCLLPQEVGFSIPRAELCAAMRAVPGVHTDVAELSEDLTAPPGAGYLVIERNFDTVAQYLSANDLTRTFLLDGAKEPALVRHLEEHQMPGGFHSSEWFKIRALDSVRYPTLRVEVAEVLGFERIDRFASEHYASYDTGMKWPELLVRYLCAHRWWATP